MLLLLDHDSGGHLPQRDLGAGTMHQEILTLVGVNATIAIKEATIPEKDAPETIHIETGIVQAIRPITTRQARAEDHVRHQDRGLPHEEITGTTIGIERSGVVRGNDQWTKAIGKSEGALIRCAMLYLLLCVTYRT